MLSRHIIFRVSSLPLNRCVSCPHLLAKVLGKPAQYDVAGTQPVLDETDGQSLGTAIDVAQGPLDVLVLVADDVDVRVGRGEGGQGRPGRRRGLSPLLRRWC